MCTKPAEFSRRLNTYIPRLKECTYDPDADRSNSSNDFWSFLGPGSTSALHHMQGPICVWITPPLQPFIISNKG